MEKYLVVVDMQNDFITGPKGREESRAIVEKVVERIRAHNGPVVYLQDTHQRDFRMIDGRTAPFEISIEGTPGWEFEPRVAAALEKKNARRFCKPSYGCPELANWLIEQHLAGNVTSIELIGIVTNICILNNALMLRSFMPEVPVIVKSDCCAGITPEEHEAALNIMRHCMIDVI